MQTELIVILVVIAIVAVIAALAMRRGGKGLAPGSSERPEPPRAEPPPRARSERPPARREEPEPAPKKPESVRPPPAEPKPAEARREEPVPEPPRAEKQAEPAVAVSRTAPISEPPPRSSQDDINALKKGLASTRGGFISRLAKLFGGKKEIDPALLEQIEEVLITADVGVPTTQKILGSLRERMDRKELSDPDKIWDAIREEARAILGGSTGGVALRQTPTVILVVGVNGVGKTTTIGKLASRLHDSGKKVILAAGDTFRAAAVLQLEVWGRRVGCEVVKGKDRADPASVIFEAIKKAQDSGADVVIADTAGRLHTKTPLMEELKKVARTVEKAIGRPADETLLVLDSTNGQNAIQQAQMFKDALSVSGIVLTKLDGTAKGGVILGIVDQHQIPVRYIGIGERVEDLREFDTSSFVAALFAKPDDESLAA